MKTIVLVDHNDIDVLIARKMLEKHIYEVEIISFSSPRVALNKILSGKLNQPIVIVDLEIPEMSGWEFIKKLEDAKHPHPVYILTVLPFYRIDADYNVRHMVKGVFTRPLGYADIVALAKENGIPYR
jgi:FixJ family two-component response regulator